MVRFFRTHFLQYPRRVNVTILAFTLLLGYSFGSIVSCFASPILFQLMRTGAMNGVSIVSVLPILLFPFLVSALAVFLRLKWLLLLVAFLKAFLFSYLGSHIFRLFPTSGPLFAVFFLTSDLLSMPVLCWFWFRCISDSDSLVRALIPVFFLVFGIGLFDYLVTSPFLASLLS